MHPERRSWLLALPALMLAVLLLGWSGYWYQTLTRTKEGFSRFEADLAARGGAFTCNEEDWGGYPFRIEVSCARLALRLSGNGPTFETVGVRALAKAYAINDVVATGQGPSRLTFEDGRTFDLKHAPMNADFRIEDDGRAAARLIVEDTVLEAEGAVLARGARLELSAHNEDADRVAFTVIGSQAVVSPSPGTDISLASLDMEGLIDKLPPGFATLPSDLLTAAATSGARLSVQSLAAVVEGSRLNGEGSLVLDAQGYPDGRIALRLSDLGRFMEGLAAKGLIERKAAAAGTLLLGLIVGNKAAPVDLTFRQGRIYWGPIKLLEHGPIR
ncbi:MAG: DUF2125 domain-containing protein [Parvibaculaceae bacterium]